MQAIRVHYLGPTDYRGSRLVATCDAGRLTVPYDYALSGEALYRTAAEALRDKLGWTGHLIGGGLADGSYAFVFAESDERPVAERISEHDLADVLTGPTSGGNAARLAAYVFGHGPEFDARPQNLQVRP